MWKQLSTSNANGNNDVVDDPYRSASDPRFLSTSTLNKSSTSLAISINSLSCSEQEALPLTSEISSNSSSSSKLMITANSQSKMLSKSLSDLIFISSSLSPSSCSSSSSSNCIGMLKEEKCHISDPVASSSISSCLSDSFLSGKHHGQNQQQPNGFTQNLLTKHHMMKRASSFPHHSVIITEKHNDNNGERDYICNHSMSTNSLRCSIATLTESPVLFDVKSQALTENFENNANNFTNSSSSRLSSHHHFKKYLTKPKLTTFELNLNDIINEHQQQIISSSEKPVTVTSSVPNLPILHVSNDTKSLDSDQVQTNRNNNPVISLASRESEIIKLEGTNMSVSVEKKINEEEKDSNIISTSNKDSMIMNSTGPTGIYKKKENNFVKRSNHVAHRCQNHYHQESNNNCEIDMPSMNSHTSNTLPHNLASMTTMIRIPTADSNLSLGCSTAMLRFPTVSMSSREDHRYLTYGTSAQLQQEYGKFIPWPTLTEFRLRRKLRRFKRRARKLFNGNNLLGKSFHGIQNVRRLIKMAKLIRSCDDSRTMLNGENQDSVLQNISRSSSLTSLLNLIEEANKNLLNSFQEEDMRKNTFTATSANFTGNISSTPPKCPPRLKRAMSSINVGHQNLSSSVMVNDYKILQSKQKKLTTQSMDRWGSKTATDNYQIAFVESKQQSQQQKIKSPTTAGDLDTISVKSLDSYFGTVSLLNVSNEQDLKKRKNEKILCVRSHFQINDGTIYLEDSDWEMCSEISDPLSLNEMNATDVEHMPNQSENSNQPSLVDLALSKSIMNEIVPLSDQSRSSFSNLDTNTPLYDEKMRFDESKKIITQPFISNKSGSIQSVSNKDNKNIDENSQETLNENKVQPEKIQPTQKPKKSIMTPPIVVDDCQSTSISEASNNQQRFNNNLGEKIALNEDIRKQSDAVDELIRLGEPNKMINVKVDKLLDVSSSEMNEKQKQPNQINNRKVHELDEKEKFKENEQKETKQQQQSLLLNNNRNHRRRTKARAPPPPGTPSKTLNKNDQTDILVNPNMMMFNQKSYHHHNYYHLDSNEKHFKIINEKMTPTEANKKPLINVMVNNSNNNLNESKKNGPIQQKRFKILGKFNKKSINNCNNSNKNNIKQNKRQSMDIENDIEQKYHEEKQQPNSVKFLIEQFNKNEAIQKLFHDSILKQQKKLSPNYTKNMMNHSNIESECSRNKFRTNFEQTCALFTSLTMKNNNNDQKNPHQSMDNVNNHIDDYFDSYILIENMIRKIVIEQQKHQVINELSDKYIDTTASNNLVLLLLMLQYQQQQNQQQQLNELKLLQTFQNINQKTVEVEHANLVKEESGERMEFSKILSKVQKLLEECRIQDKDIDNSQLVIKKNSDHDGSNREEEQQNNQQKTKTQKDEDSDKDNSKEETTKNKNRIEQNANVQCSNTNRFVNKIVLNNSINQFNFNMKYANQNLNSDDIQTKPNNEEQPITTTAPQIFNVLTDNSCNQAFNQFDINSINKQATTTLITTPTNEDMDKITGLVNINLVEPKSTLKDNANKDVGEEKSTKALDKDKPQHRTVLQIKSNSCQSKFGLIHSLRYQLEKKRNKSRMKRIRREQKERQMNQLSQSRLSLTSVIEEQVEPNSTTGTLVTLANTSTIEIKSTQSNQLKKKNQKNNNNGNKRKALRRFLFTSLSREVAPNESKNKKNEKIKKQNKNGNKPMDISEPYPLGIESSILLGTSNVSLKNCHHDNNSRSRSKSKSCYHYNYHQEQQQHPSPSIITQCSNKRNFRSIIKLNESFDHESPVEGEEKNEIMEDNEDDDDDDDDMDYHYGYELPSDSYSYSFRQRVLDNRGHKSKKKYHRTPSRLGNQMNLSSSTITNSTMSNLSQTSSSLLSSSSQLGVSRIRLLNSRPKLQQKLEKNQSCSSISMRKPMVTFTLPRSFKPKQQNFYNYKQDGRCFNRIDNDNHNDHGQHFNEEDTDQEEKFERSQAYEQEDSEGEVTSEDELGNNDNYKYYHLSPRSKLNERYFRIMMMGGGERSHSELVMGGRYQ